jgi:hypothetical protein
MVKYCGQTQRKGCGLTFHEVPSDAEKRLLWFKAIEEKAELRSNCSLSDYTSVVCSKHFDRASDYNGSRLKPTAVPHLFEQATISHTSRVTAQDNALVASPLHKRKKTLG